jgi:hypothetical protein
MLCELDSHQEAAIRSANDSEAAGRGDLTRNHILRDCVKVVVNALPMRFETGFVPCRTKLSPAADVANGKRPAALEL